MPIRRYQPRLKTCTAINTEMMTLSPDDRARDRFLADGATGRLSVCAIATIYLSICLQAASTWAIAMPQALAVIGVLSLASSGAGHLILRAFDDRTSITRPAIEIIIGVIALGYTLFAARFFFGMDIRIAAGVFAALGCAGFLMLLRDSRIAGVRQDDSGFAALALLLACAGFSAIWSLESVSRLLESQADGRFRFWSDMFIHAGTIAELGDWRDAGRGAMALADMPAALYHYVSFTFPALLTAMTDMPGLSAIFAVWLPLGILLLALAVAAAGHELGGAAGSLASVVLLVALPDPSMYGLENGFLGFHWLLETAPTTLYGLALCCLSLIWLKRWCETGDWRQLLLSILLMAAVYFARAHLLAWFLPSWAYVVLWQLMSMRPSLRWPAIAAATAAGLAALIAINWKNAQPDVPDFLFRYIEFVNLYQNPTAYDGLYAWLMSALGRAGAAPIGILLTVIAMIGAPLLTFLLLFAMALRQRRLDVIDGICADSTAQRLDGFAAPALSMAGHRHASVECAARAQSVSGCGIEAPAAGRGAAARCGAACQLLGRRRVESPPLCMGRTLSELPDRPRSGCGCPLRSRAVWPKGRLRHGRSAGRRSLFRCRHDRAWLFWRSSLGLKARSHSGRRRAQQRRRRRTPGHSRTRECCARFRGCCGASERQWRHLVYRDRRSGRSLG
jgi:hypothetical protein